MTEEEVVRHCEHYGELQILLMNEQGRFTGPEQLYVQNWLDGLATEREAAGDSLEAAPTINPLKSRGVLIALGLAAGIFAATAFFLLS